MATLIKNLDGYDTLVKLKDGLFIRVFVDPEKYAVSKNMPYEFWEKTALRLSQSCETCITSVFKHTGSLPVSGDFVRNSTDPCKVLDRTFEHFGDGVVVIFECQQWLH